jgi:precorrin-2 dehydrogenase / sirohydrochlorin ferrochelatase
MSDHPDNPPTSVPPTTTPSATSAVQGFAPFLAALKLRGLKCLVVGEGAELTRRVRTLLDTDAKLNVLSKSPEPELQALADSGKIHLEQRDFSAADLDDVWFALLTTRDAALGRAIGDAARVRRVFFCAVDEPSVSTFSHMAIATADPLRVAISTAGRAPALAARLRAELERLFSENDFEKVVKRLATLREQTKPEDRKSVLTDAAARIRFTGSIVEDRGQNAE